MNGSFEDFDNCPIGTTNPPGNPFSIPNWNAIGTCDYYNDCNNAPNGNEIVGVPHNLFTTSSTSGLSPVSGNAYAGFISTEATHDANLLITSSVIEREILFATVNLTAGVEYDVSCFVSLAPDSKYATDLTMVITRTDPSTLLASELLDFNPEEVYTTPEVVNNIGSWQLLFKFYTPSVSGTYYFAIGNFHSGANTNFEFAQNNCVDCSNNYAYYFIDDVGFLARGCCPENLNISNLSLGNEVVTYSALHNVSIGPDIQFGTESNVHVIAGERIEMNPGFTADGYFLAEIGACPGTTQFMSVDFLNTTLTVNNDGIEDEICCIANGSGDYSVIVSTLGGAIIYENTALIENVPFCVWDGTCNSTGAVCADGLYNVSVSLLGCEGELHTESFVRTVSLLTISGRYEEPIMDSIQGVGVNPNSTLQPNPTTGQITYTGTGPLQTAQLMDLTGRTLFTVSLSSGLPRIEGPSSGTSTQAGASIRGENPATQHDTATQAPASITIDLSPYTPGTYLLRIQYTTGKTETHRVLRQ